MAAKKPQQANPAADAAAAGIPLPPSPCRQRGAEIPSAVFAARTQRVQAWCMVCSSPARLRVTISSVGSTSTGGTVLFDQEIPPPNPVTLDLSPLPPGQYLVHWGYVVTGPSWEVVTEVIVDDVTRFRKRNGAQDGIPANTIFTYLQIT